MICIIQAKNRLRLLRCKHWLLKYMHSTTGHVITFKTQEQNDLCAVFYQIGNSNRCILVLHMELAGFLVFKHFISKYDISLLRIILNSRALPLRNDGNIFQLLKKSIMTSIQTSIHKHGHTRPVVNPSRLDSSIGRPAV